MVPVEGPVRAKYLIQGKSPFDHIAKEEVTEKEDPVQSLEVGVPSMEKSIPIDFPIIDRWFKKQPVVAPRSQFTGQNIQPKKVT